MPVSKPVYRNNNTNQSCVQRSRKPRKFEKVYYFVSKSLDSQKKFLLFYDCRTYENIFRLFDDSANKTKAFNLKVNCKELRLVFVHHVNTECT